MPIVQPRPLRRRARPGLWRLPLTGVLTGLLVSALISPAPALAAPVATAQATGWSDWGRGPLGAGWSVSSGQSVSATSSRGRFLAVPPQGSATADLDVDFADVSVRADVISPMGLSFAGGVAARVDATSAYRAVARVDEGGRPAIDLLRVSSGQERVLASSPLLMRARESRTLAIELNVVETPNGAQLTARAFTSGAAPGWQVRALDAAPDRPRRGKIGLIVKNLANSSRDMDVANVVANPPVDPATSAPAARFTPTPSPTSSPTPSPTPSPAPSPTPGTPGLPFDLTPTANAKPVYAMYFPPYPVSIDNAEPKSDYYTANYLNPMGEGGKHAAYGGLLRDRPAPQPPIKDPAWKLRNLESEVLAAKSAGLQGFTLNVLGTGPDPGDRLWDTSVDLMRAATNVGGFKVAIMPDITAYPTASVAEVAATTAALAAYPSAAKLPDGRLLVMPFYAEGHDVSWWRAFLDQMDRTHHLKVALIPIFVSAATELIPRYAPVSYGVSTWGVRNPAWNDPRDTGPGTQPTMAALARANGLAWIQSVSAQDERPNQSVYDEAENTTNLRRTWQLAQDTRADMVHALTWNDYSEGTQLAPSLRRGRTFLDITAFYARAYQTGATPRIVRDAAYVTHRQQPVSARPTFATTSPMSVRGGSAPRDTVEVLTMLTAPAAVNVSVGGVTNTCAAPAGVGVCTVPLRPGTVSVQVWRDNTNVLSVTSPYPVTNAPEVQDLQYVGTGAVARP